MAAIEVSITVEAPSATVWAELERIEDHSKWMTDAVAIRFEDEQRRGVGTRISVDTEVGPFKTVDRMEFVRWEPGVAIGVRHQGLVGGVGEFTLQRVGEDRTLVTWRERLEFPWYFGGSLGAWLAKPILGYVWRGNLRRLAERVA